MSANTWSNVPRVVPQADKHRLLRTSGSVGLKHLARQDIAVGTHTDLTIRTQVWNPSHRHLTSLDQGHMHKCHHDYAKG
jgi:hypothetical protein